MNRPPLIDQIAEKTHASHVIAALKNVAVDSTPFYDCGAVWPKGTMPTQIFEAERMLCQLGIMSHFTTCNGHPALTWVMGANVGVEKEVSVL